MQQRKYRGIISYILTLILYLSKTQVTAKPYQNDEHTMNSKGGPLLHLVHADGNRKRSGGTDRISSFRKTSLNSERHHVHIRSSRIGVNGRINKSGEEIKAHQKKDSANEHEQPSLPLIPHVHTGVQEKENCSTFKSPKTHESGTNFTGYCHSPNKSLTCFQDPIYCEAYHLSGKRDQTWPVYGEYSYLPHEHWFKVLQHGGVAFLYHPCLHDSLIKELRLLASQCLRRYIMTPYRKLDQNKPIALVTWGCYLLMSSVDFHASKRWMRQHAFKGPSTHVHKNGNFEKRLVNPSRVVTDIQDTFLCPDELEKASFITTAAPTKKRIIAHVGERVILQRLAKAQHRITKVVNANITLTKVNKRNAAWAVGSLVFLCGLLVALMIYTKLWEDPSPGQRYQYSAVYDDDPDFVSPKKRHFNFMKSSQALIGKIRKKKRRHRGNQNEMQLLTPINEENEDSSDEF